MFIESLVRSGLASGVLLLAMRLALAPSGINPTNFMSSTSRDYRRLVVLGLCLGCAVGLDWVWISWLFIFLVYLKGRQWLPIHKLAGHSLFWLGYILGAVPLIAIQLFMPLDWWGKSGQPQSYFWLWLILTVSFVFFVGDGFNRLRRTPGYWQNTYHELILAALLLLVTLTASYFDISRLLTIIPALWLCYYPRLAWRYQSR